MLAHCSDGLFYSGPKNTWFPPHNTQIAYHPYRHWPRHWLQIFLHSLLDCVQWLFSSGPLAVNEADPQLMSLWNTLSDFYGELMTYQPQVLKSVGLSLVSDPLITLNPVRLQYYSNNGEACLKLLSLWSTALIVAKQATLHSLTGPSLFLSHHHLLAITLTWSL